MLIFKSHGIVLFIFYSFDIHCRYSFVVNKSFIHIYGLRLIDFHTCSLITIYVLEKLPVKAFVVRKIS